MTSLEKKLVEAIENGGELWDLIKIAQQYDNDLLIDRVLDNIIKYGIEGIKEKPNRIFYGDNRKLLPLEEEIVGDFGCSDIHITDSIGVGEDFDKAAEVILECGIEGCEKYLKAMENRKPEILNTITLKLPEPQWKVIYRKHNSTLTSNLRKICNAIGIELPECEDIIDLPEGFACINSSTTTITIITIK